MIASACILDCIAAEASTGRNDVALTVEPRPQLRPGLSAFAGRLRTSSFEPSATPERLIMGLGNSLMRDDGVGMHVARRLALDPPPQTLALEVGTDVFNAVAWLQRVPWVLAVDAMDAGGVPGTIYHCDVADLSDFRQPISLHELSLVAVLEFIPVAQRPKIAVLGIQPALVDHGASLSPVLEQAMPRILEAARTVVAAQVEFHPVRQAVTL